MAGEERGDGILGEVGRGEREGESPRDGAVLVRCFAASETIFVPDIQYLFVQPIVGSWREVQCCTEVDKAAVAVGY